MVRLGRIVSNGDSRFLGWSGTVYTKYTRYAKYAKFYYKIGLQSACLSDFEYFVYFEYFV
ncbi:hypothetical protein [Methanocella sp. MCL-LM]|uniref:hypothetical protein n=1 Tax=Methanocella sp. MCL-LM TaxID=3412035 RepID=UPI003C725623